MYAYKHVERFIWIYEHSWKTRRYLEVIGFSIFQKPCTKLFLWEKWSLHSGNPGPKFNVYRFRRQTSWRNFSFDFAADKGHRYRGSHVARLDATCHVANFYECSSASFNRVAAGAPFDAVDSAATPNTPGKTAAVAWKRVLNIMDGVKCVAVVLPKWALLAHMLARTNRADRPRSNTWEHRPSGDLLSSNFVLVLSSFYSHLPIVVSNLQDPFRKESLKS